MSITRKNRQAGFTIVELMIATSIFSVVLLVVAYGVINFTRSYYHGVNASSTQNMARGIIDDVSQALQFSGGNFTQLGGTGGSPATTYCIGNKQFDLIFGKVVGAVPHILVESDNQSSGGGCIALNMTSPASANKPQDLITGNTRLLEFNIAPIADSSQTYAVTVTLGYGDDDLLCDSSVTGDCSSSTTSTHLADGGTSPTDIFKCKSGAGSQFCAVTELTTTIQMRLAPGM